MATARVAPEARGPFWVKKTVDAGTVETLIKKLNDVTAAMEKMNIAEYVEFIRNPRRMAYVNFIAGLSRGFGAAVGATLLAAIFIYILTRLVSLNLPIIGRFIAEIVEIVRQHLRP